MKIFKSLSILRFKSIDLLTGMQLIDVLSMLRKHQFMDPQILNAIRKKKFNELLERAKNSTAFYKNMTTYQKLEVLTKDDVKSNFDSFVSESYNGKKFAKGTGGSTGIPLIYYTTPLVRSYLWAGILLSWEAAGYKLGDKVAFIAGTSILKKDFRHFLFYKMMNIEVFSAFTLDARSIALYIHKLQKSKTKIIYAYATALQEMAAHIHKHGPVQFPHLRSIVSTAEVLTEEARQQISRAFKVDVYNQYGCNEAGISAFECHYHKMHLISTRCYYESDAKGGLISSDMINEAFVMLKYHTGDIVEFSLDSQCNCGRTYPIINRVIGRTFDIVKDKKNNMLHSAYFSMLFRNDPYIKQFQILVNKKSIEINLKLDESKVDNKYFDKYLAEIKNRLSFDEYIISLNDSFLRSDNAKHRHIVNLDR